MVAEGEPSGADVVLAPEQLELSAVWREAFDDAVYFIGFAACLAAISYTYPSSWSGVDRPVEEDCGGAPLPAVALEAPISSRLTGSHSPNLSNNNVRIDPPSERPQLLPLPRHAPLPRPPDWPLECDE